tara:strand:- start:11292 stop:12026 length:735 start_codon:yes stop_codon:yes gene_type:complete
MRYLYSFAFLVFFTVLGFNSFGQNDTSRIALFVDGVKVRSDYEGWRRSGPDATPYRYNDSGFLCQGEYLYFYESGALKHRGFYKNGRIEGKRYDYHENGQLKDSSTTANGRWVDSSWSYYPNGTLERMCVHLTGDGYGSPLISYYENGQIKDHEFLDTQGYFRFRYMMGEEGDTIFAEYLIDKKNLIYNNYSRYDNGQLEYVGKTCYSLETGYMHLGVWKYYNEEGEIIETKKYPTFEKLESDK